MLSVHTTTIGPIAILSLEGSITIGETAPLCSAFAAQSQADVIILDLANASMIDAYGLGVMLELRAWARAKRKGFKLMNVKSAVAHVLEITHLDIVFEVVSQREVLTRSSQLDDEPTLELVS